MNKNTKRVLIIADVIAQLKSRKFLATSGKYFDTATLQTVLMNAQSSEEKTDDGAAIKKAVCQLENCEVCAKGSMFISYIERFNTVSGKMFNAAYEYGGIEKRPSLTCFRFAFWLKLKPHSRANGTTRQFMRRCNRATFPRCGRGMMPLSKKPLATILSILCGMRLRRCATSCSLW